MSDESGTETFRRRLALVLERLTWDADAQLDHLHAEGVGPDELALEFDDALNVVRARVAEGSVSATVLGALSEVDARFADMTRQGAGAWTEHSVRASAEWSAVRVSAQQALAKISADCSGG